MYDKNGQIRLVMKMTLRLWKDTHFICKIPFLKKNWDSNFSQNEELYA